MRAVAPLAGLVARRSWITLLIFSWVVCVDPDTALSGFGESCTAFAQVTATRKTGQTTELDDGWHRAYSQALNTCSQAYGGRSARPQNTDAKLISDLARGKVRSKTDLRPTKLQVAPRAKKKPKSAKKVSEKIKSKSEVANRKRLRVTRKPGNTIARRIGQVQPRVRRGPEHTGRKPPAVYVSRRQ
jgi:hypothetical protein